MECSISKAEAARRLGVSRANINYLVQQGHLKTMKGSRGYDEITEQSVEERLEKHGTKTPYFSNDEVKEMFEEYLKDNCIEFKAVKSVYSGETGPDFYFTMENKEYFVECIGSNPSRGTQSNAFRAAFQGAISRISDPLKQVPVILMHVRERRGMRQRALSWGKWGWRTCFEKFELWLIDEDGTGLIILNKVDALEFTPSV